MSLALLWHLSAARTAFVVCVCFSCARTVTPFPDGRYALVTLAGKDPADLSFANLCEVPTASVYVFTERRWWLRDSLPIRSGCAAEVDSSAWAELRTDSGYFDMKGDSVLLFVADKNVGLQGFIGYLIIAQDTLISPQSELDPGDYVYVRDSVWS